jgi:cobalt-precorrin 5A hydrolase
MGEALMVVAGIGCRRGATAEQVEAALVRALATLAGPTQGCLTAGLTHDALTLSRIATAASKGNEPGIRAAASARGIPLVLISHEDLEANNAKTLTRSSNSMRAMNVHSVAEAAALAGAGQGSRLLGRRIAVGPVTCALAVALDAAEAAGARPPEAGEQSDMVRHTEESHVS